MAREPSLDVGCLTSFPATDAAPFTPLRLGATVPSWTRGRQFFLAVLFSRYHPG